MVERFRVLVIDDDPGIREYLKALGERQGYQVSVAVDGEEALASLSDSVPDIVTLDAVLPGMDGLETLRQMKKLIPDVPVIMLSGHGQARRTSPSLGPSILTPIWRKASKVAKLSSPSKKPFMELLPRAKEARISARCEIDLSPGTRTRPDSRPPGCTLKVRRVGEPPFAKPRE